VLVKSTIAYIGSGAQVKAEKSILVTALSQDCHVSVAMGFAGGGSAGVGGAVSVSVVVNTTEAYSGSEATLLSEGGIKVLASNYTTMVLAAGAGAGGGAAGVGASFAVAVFAAETRAYLGAGTVANARGLLQVKADSAENVVATAVAGAGGGAAGVAGSLSVKVVSTTTEAYIGGGARINQDSAYASELQSVAVEATDRVLTVGLGGSRCRRRRGRSRRLC
jgi:hypothetical protein